MNVITKSVEQEEIDGQQNDKVTDGKIDVKKEKIIAYASIQLSDEISLIIFWHTK